LEGSIPLVTDEDPGIQNASFTCSSVRLWDMDHTRCWWMTSGGFPHEVPTPNNQDPLARSHQELRGRSTAGSVQCRISSHAAGTPSSVTLPGFLKTRRLAKHSGVMLIWLLAISLTKAGSVAQAVPTTDRLTSYAGTTTTHHQLTCGEDPPLAVIREWRYGPRRLHIDDEE